MWSDDDVQKQIISCSQIQNGIQSLISNQTDRHLTEAEKKQLLMSLYKKFKVSDEHLARVSAMNIKQHQMNTLIRALEMDQAFYKSMKTSHEYLSQLVQGVSQKDVDILLAKYKQTLEKNSTGEIIEGFSNIFCPVNEQLAGETEKYLQACTNQFNQNTKEFIQKCSQPSILNEISIKSNLSKSTHC